VIVKQKIYKRSTNHYCGLSFNSQSSAPSLAPSLDFNTPSASQNWFSPQHLAHPVVGQGQAKQPLLVLSQSQMQHLPYAEAQDLVKKRRKCTKSCSEGTLRDRAWSASAQKY
jgi:hypothetical protein